MGKAILTQPETQASISVARCQAIDYARAWECCYPTTVALEHLYGHLRACRYRRSTYLAGPLLVASVGLCKILRTPRPGVSGMLGYDIFETQLTVFNPPSSAMKPLQRR